MSVTVEEEMLVDRVRSGDARAAARLMTWAERADARFAEAHAGFAAGLGHARRLGITGPPGAGKSTLVEALCKHWRTSDARTLGVLAVDPSSPFSGGALLGDRVRMSALSLDPGVFVRSMATRGAFGGLARATDDLADVLDLLGRHTILVETVGVGQSEVDVVRSTDLTVLVLHPGAGDTIQAMKAGLMEAADLYVVNKSDLPDAERLVHEIADALDLRRGDRERPPVVTVSAVTGAGLPQLAQTLDRLLDVRTADGRLARRRTENLASRVRRLVDAELRREAWERAGLEGELVRRMAGPGTLSVYALAAGLLAAFRARAAERGDA
ncbi:MAG: methylmalonyl Co-A mutase-associated GTPase MeaB [Planctomycetes bacterium]|nr:methylmalonyl Co-A mutase-associated GTPase MeaB [Planctomycetota bacterium]